jgi:hypothetical protein
MNMLDALLGSQGKAVLQQLGQQFGLNEDQASSALGALLPALAAGFQRNASSASGLESLLGALSGGRHLQYLDDLGSLNSPDTVLDGNGILGHIFGSKDVSREVAQRAAAQSGVGADVLKRMLPVLATIVMGALAKQQLGGASAQAGLRPGAGGPARGGGLLDVLAPMLDSNRDGSMVDDVIGMIGKFMGGR